MKGLTGNKDVDFVILNKLSDYELGKVCQVNKKVNILCNDDNFWQIRTYQKLGKYIEPINPKDRIITTWKDYYTSMIKHINDFKKGDIVLSDGVVFYKKKEDLSELKFVTGGEDLKNVLQKIKNEESEYKDALKNSDFKKIKEAMGNDFIDVNTPIRSLDAKNIGILEFLEKEPRIDKKYIKGALYKIANDIIFAYTHGQVNDNYVHEILKANPNLEKILKVE